MPRLQRSVFDVAVRAAHPGPSERVDVGRSQVARAMDSKVGVTHVVADDDQDVRLALSGGLGSGGDQRNNTKKQTPRESCCLAHGALPR